MRRLSTCPAAPPELPTARLTLRPYGPEAAYAFWQLLHQNRDRLQPDFPDRTKAVQTLADAEHRLKVFALQRRAGDLYSFGIWRREQKDYIGDITLRRLTRGKPLAEVGYYLAGGVEGNGFATEALHALAQYAFKTLRMECVHVRCAEGNEKSRRVAERCGFTHSKTYTPTVPEEPGQPPRAIHVYRLLPPDLKPPAQATYF